MTDTAYFMPPTGTQLQAILTSQAPPAEATAAAAGAGQSAARDDHVHPRLTSTTVQSTLPDGTQVVMFTKTFPAGREPGILFTSHDTSGQPVQFSAGAYVLDGSSNIIGVNVKGYRSQTIPTNLVTALLSGVFNIFGGTVGVTKFTCVAIAASN